MLASFTSTDSESENPPLGNPLRFRAVENRSKRLRQSVGAAWRHSKAGLIWQQDGMSNAEFAGMLSDVGIPCTRADVENAARKPFAPKKCPPTPAVFEALGKLAGRLPSLDASVFIASANGSIDLLSTIGAPCPFIAGLTLSA